MIIGHGVDIVECERVQRLIESHPERALERLFTPAEQAYCDEYRRRREEHYAARFAAKEAVLKALGTGYRDGMAFTDIEVLPDPLGKPVVRVAGVVAEVAARLGVTHWHISLSHTAAHAIASVIAERRA